MKKLYTLFLFFSLLQTYFAVGQDMHFTQFYASPLYLNPAFTGVNVCSRVSLTYRNQWPGVSKAYRSFLAAGDHYFQKQHLGIGILLGNDEAGSGQLKTTIIVPSFAYELVIDKYRTVRFGLQPGIGIKSINYDNLLFGDQIARGGNVATIENTTSTKAYFDANAGVLYYTSQYWIGLSLFHLNRPNESLLAGDARLPIKFTLHGGYTHPLTPKEKDIAKQRFISAAFHLRGQKKFDQNDVGVYYTQGYVNFGVWYRGIPFIKSYKPGYANNDALAFIIGVKATRFNIGYSYDITISKLARISNGAHEITIAYQLCNPQKKKKPRTQIACPKF
jgi:type IX secretion system PorP/SprF family membrane protein